MCERDFECRYQNHMKIIISWNYDFFT